MASSTSKKNDIPANAETAANTLICLIHQANFLLDQLLRTLGKEFLEKGDFNERLYQVRFAARVQREK